MTKKNLILQKLYELSLGFIQVLSPLFLGLLFFSAFFFTCYAKDMESQLVLTKWDNPFFNLFGMGLFLLFFFGITHLVSKHPKRRKVILLSIVLILVTILGGILVVFGKTVPAADAMSVYSIAEHLANGDTSVIHPTDSYLSYYPQQVGLVAFYELLIRIIKLLPFDLPAYHFIKCLYVLFVDGIIYFGYKTIQLFDVGDRTESLFLLLCGTNLPLLFYSSFVYGEIPSFTALSVGIYFLFSFALPGSPQRKRLFSSPYLNMGFSLLFFTSSVMLRKNSLVIIIAVLLVVLIEWIRTKKHALLVFALFCGIFCMGILPMTQAYYEHRAHSSLKTGVPAFSYFAMGMQESSRGNGWYNGFNFYTYQDSKMDTEITVAKSKEAISERLAFFRQNPGYTFRFYWGKHLSQWADGTYACRQATLATFGGRSSFFHEVYEGSLANILIAYCNAYQNILYFFALVFFLFCSRQKKTKDLYPYLGLIGVFGGFLFHILWEANSRYILIYGFLLLPYAACGLNRAILWYQEKLSKKRGNL